MKKKNTSIDDLAIMIARGFSETALKSDVAALKSDLEEFKKETEDNFHKVRGDILSMADSFVPRSEFETRLSKLQNAIEHQNERLSRFAGRR